VERKKKNRNKFPNKNKFEIKILVYRYGKYEPIRSHGDGERALSIRNTDREVWVIGNK
jgi:hypothetical protein